MLADAISMADSLRPIEIPRLQIKCHPEEASIDGARQVTPVEFARDFVGHSKPAILVGLDCNLDFWSDNHKIVALMGSSKCTVALTPNGRADAITEVASASCTSTLFMSAADASMDLPTFFCRLKDCHMSVERAHKKGLHGHHRCVSLSDEKGNAPVPYIQLQNGSLSVEFSKLIPQVPPSLAHVGKMIFGPQGTPAAENLWIGSRHSLTKMHQDWYDNLYLVVRGSKEFTLVPPWETAFLSTYKRRVRCARYVVEQGQIADEVELESLEDATPDSGYNMWLDADFVDLSDEERVKRFPLTAHCHPITVTVGAGEALYLPAMWFHAVGQREDPREMAKWRRDGCPPDATPCVIAVNYWYEMNCEMPLFWLQDFLGKIKL